MAFDPIASPRGPGTRQGVRWVSMRIEGSAVPFVLPALLLVVLKLWLVAGQELFAQGSSFADDELFLRLADSLSEGDWFGHYDHYTLVKGPVYPAWIAFTSWLGISLLRSQHLLYTAMCAFFVLAVRPFVRPPWVLMLLFTLLLFDPVTFSVHALRVVREGIYPALVLGVCAGLASLLAGRRASLPSLLARALVLGALLCALWLTREEGVWILPAYAAVAGWIAFDLWRRGGSRPALRAGICLLPLALIGLSDFAVSLQNARRYGVFSVSELQSVEFRSAYGALLRAGEPDAPRYVLVSHEARERIYAVSPTFARLRPMLEGELGRTYAGFAARGIPELEGSDEPAGYLLWAIRDAAASAGFHASGVTAMASYRQLADEVNLACESETLPCGTPRSTLQPPLSIGQAWPFVRALGRAMVSALQLEGFSAVVLPSSGSPAQLDVFRRLTGERVAAPPMPAEAGKLVPRGDPWRIAVLETIGVSYSAATPWLAAAALAVFTAGLIRPRERGAARSFGLGTRPLTVLCAALLLLFLSRIGLLALLHATSFAAIYLQYLAPAYPPLYAFCVLAVFDAAARRSEQRRATTAARTDAVPPTLYSLHSREDA